MATSAENVNAIKKRMMVQTIGPDKINQLRHMKYIKNLDGLLKHMDEHAAILRPRFLAVGEVLERELGGTGIAEWSKPNGGYFVSLNTADGCAKRVVELCAQAGVVLTSAGATYPYKKDPHDSNIRIAPTSPTVDELKKAIYVLSVCVKLAAAEKLLAEN